MRKAKRGRRSGPQSAPFLQSWTLDFSGGERNFLDPNFSHPAPPFVQAAMAVRLKTRPAFVRAGIPAMSETQTGARIAPAQTNPQINPVWGYLAAGVGSALFASKAIFIKIAYRHG